MVFLDTAVVMYAVGRPHPYREACAAILREIVAGRLEAAPDTEVFQEVLHRLTAIGRRAEALQVIQDLGAAFPQVFPVTRDVVAWIPELGRAHEGLSARDLVHLAVMRHYGPAEILTADRDFEGIPGVVRLDPIVFAVERGLVEPPEKTPTDPE